MGYRRMRAETGRFKRRAAGSTPVRWQALLALVLLASGLLPGCVDPPGLGDGPGDGDSGAQDEDEPSQRTYEECDSLSLTSEDGTTTWQVARVSCEANVPGEDDETIACQQPEEAEVTASANLSSGEVVIQVHDPSGNRLLDHRLTDTGGQPRNLSLDAGGQAGEWRLSGERAETYEGTYRAELACPEG